MEKSQEKAAKRIERKVANADRIPGSGPEIETESVDSYTLPPDER